jgi:hypothetical protein
LVKVGEDDVPRRAYPRHMSLAASSKFVIPAVVIPIVVSVAASYGTWRLVQKPQNDKQESRDNATLALNELRAAIDAFKEQAHTDPPVQTVRLLREGRLLLWQEQYDDALSRLRKGFSAAGEGLP